MFLCGWILHETPLARPTGQWLRNRCRIGFILLNHVSLVAFLACVYNASEAWPLFVLLFLISLLVYRKSIFHIPAGYWISSLALILFTLGVNRWWFSIIGDEYAFFRYAQIIVEQHNLANVGDHLFYGQGVYQAHPYVSSLIQAVFMKIFGAYNFGWRFSSIYLSAIAVGLFHSVFRSFLRKRVADVAALFLAFSHYLISFGKIGYNNLQAFFLLALVLYFTRRAIVNKRMVDFAFLGCCCGLCFYVYPAALFVPPVSFLFLILYESSINRSIYKKWGALMLFFILLLLPLFSQSTYWVNKIPGTFLYTPALSASISNIAYHISSNILSALFSFLYAPQETHFVAASYIDPLSAVFAIIGLSLLVSKFRSHKFLIFLLGSFVYMLFFLGATHDRSVPSTTRMFLMLPWFAVFSAVGFMWLIRELKRIHLNRVLLAGAGTLILITCLVINLYQAYPLAQKRMAYRYQSFQVLFLRDAPQFITSEIGSPQNVTIVNRADRPVLESLFELLDIYRVPYTHEQFREADTETILEGELDDKWLSDTHSLIIITPWVYGETRDAVEDMLALAGKQQREIKNAAGDMVFVVWESTIDEK
jgi:hypothetical protein